MSNFTTVSSSLVALIMMAAPSDALKLKTNGSFSASTYMHGNMPGSTEGPWVKSGTHTQRVTPYNGKLTPIADVAVIAAGQTAEEKPEPITSPLSLALLSHSLKPLPPLRQADKPFDDTASSEYSDSSRASSASEHEHGDAAPHLVEHLVDVAEADTPRRKWKFGSNNKVKVAPYTGRNGSASKAQPRVSASSPLSKKAQFFNLARAKLYGTRQVPVDVGANEEEREAIWANLTPEQRHEQEVRLVQQAAIGSTNYLRTQAQEGRAIMDKVRISADILRSRASVTREAKRAAELTQRQERTKAAEQLRKERKEARELSKAARTAKNKKSKNTAQVAPAPLENAFVSR